MLLGLLGFEPDTVDVDGIAAHVKGIRDDKCLRVLGEHELAFAEKTDLVLYRRETLPFHANGMRFTAFDASGAALLTRVYYSVGGGFIVSEEVAQDGSTQKVLAPDVTVLTHPFHSGADWLMLTK